MKNDIFTSNIDNESNENSSKSEFIRYKSVISEMMKISYRIERRCINTEKLRKYAFSLSQNLMKGGSELGDTQYCVLARITAKGYEYMNPELLNECSTVIAINDEYGAVADELLSFIKCEAVSRKIDIICCYNPFLQYALERIILPHKKIAICRSCSLCPQTTAGKNIHYERFCDMDMLKEQKQTLTFNKKLIRELIPNCHQIIS